MKRVHCLLMAGLCLIAACEPSPSAPGTGGDHRSKLGVSHLMLVFNIPPFGNQKVCSTGIEQVFEVFNENKAEIRRISFAQTDSPFTLTSIKNDAGPVNLPVDLPSNKSLFLDLL